MRTGGFFRRNASCTRITRVEVLEHYRLSLTFEDGVGGTVDLSELVGSGVFALWNRYDDFRKVRIGDSGN